MFRPHNRYWFNNLDSSIRENKLCNSFHLPANSSPSMLFNTSFSKSLTLWPSL
jgi:hypothetical protein